jgi:protein gp37
VRGVWARPDKPWLDGLPRLVFLDDMGDTLTESLPRDWLAPLLPRLAESPHRWLLLTKRATRLAEFSRRHPLPANVWPGVSVTTRGTLRRIAELRTVAGGGLRWVSAEPLLEDLGARLDLGGVGWVVVGGESGPGHRPMEHAWASSIERQCRRAGIPFFFKQSAAFRPESGVRLCGREYRGMPA